MNTDSKLRWCLHCERVRLPLEQFHFGQLVEFCGYMDCDGGPLDLWAWWTDGDRGRQAFGLGPDAAEYLAKSRHPAVPVDGVVYVLYQD